MKKWLKEHSMTSVVLLSLLVEFTLETLFRHTPVKALLFVWQKPHLFLLNSLIVLVTYSISFPFRKRFAIKTTVTLLWLTFGVTNFVISLYRRLPFTMVDVLLVKALFSLIDVYFNPFQIFLMFAALIGVAEVSFGGNLLGRLFFGKCLGFGCHASVSDVKGGLFPVGKLCRVFAADLIELGKSAQLGRRRQTEGTQENGGGAVQNRPSRRIEPSDLLDQSLFGQ